VDWGRRGHERMGDDGDTGGRGTTAAATLHLGGTAGSRWPGAVVEEGKGQQCQRGRRAREARQRQHSARTMEEESMGSGWVGGGCTAEQRGPHECRAEWKGGDNGVLPRGDGER
jgi:hypothetical protein